MEQWKPVVGYESYYEVSDRGRVRSTRRCGTGGGIKALIETHRGHLRADLCKDGKQKSKKVHRLVLEAFDGLCPDGMECRHLNGNPKDNRLENLSWGTHLENRADMIDHGRSTTGERNPMAKLSEWDVRWIKRFQKHGFATQTYLAEVFGCSVGNISNIKHGHCWRHVGV